MPRQSHSAVACGCCVVPLARAHRSARFGGATAAVCASVGCRLPLVRCSRLRSATGPADHPPTLRCAGGDMIPLLQVHARPAVMGSAFCSRLPILLADRADEVCCTVWRQQARLALAAISYECSAMQQMLHSICNCCSAATALADQATMASPALRAKQSGHSAASSITACAASVCAARYSWP